MNTTKYCEIRMIITKVGKREKERNKGKKSKQNK